VAYSNKLTGARLGKPKKLNYYTPLLFLFAFQFIEKKQQKMGYPRSVRQWKNRLKGLLKHVWLGQVRKVIRSSKSETMGPPIYFLACFEQKFERTVLESTTSYVIT